jgi:hypothetical protein
MTTMTMEEIKLCAMHPDVFEQVNALASHEPLAIK